LDGCAHGMAAERTPAVGHARPDLLLSIVECVRRRRTSAQE
jgi:hypothetical protein